VKLGSGDQHTTLRLGFVERRGPEGDRMRPVSGERVKLDVEISKKKTVGQNYFFRLMQSLNIF